MLSDVGKIKQSFSILSKNPENMFSDYLKSHNLTEIEFLFQLGLNRNLVNEHNFNEINALILEVLDGNNFPELTVTNTEDLATNNISLYNKDNNKVLVIGENSLRFDTNEEEAEKKFINHALYTINKDILRKIDIKIIFSYLQDTNLMEYFEIQASQTDYQNTGEVLADNNFILKNNGNVYQSVFKKIYRSLLTSSITNALNKVIELIKSERITKDQIQIKMNYSDLNKK